MTVMATKTITCGDNHGFDELVKEFLEKYEDLLLHDKTVFAITQDTFLSKPVTMYSAIFYGELGCISTLNPPGKTPTNTEDSTDKESTK